MVQSQTLFPAMQNDHSARAYLRGATYSSPSHRSVCSPLTQRPTLLLIAAQDLLPKLAGLLDTDAYTVYTTAETIGAQAILATVSIDLLLLHCPVEMGIGAWETYTKLRQLTMKPVLLISNITWAHLAMNHAARHHAAPEAISEGLTNGRMRSDLVNYRKAIDLLCHRLILEDRP